MVVTERYARETGRDYALRMLKKNIISLNLVPGTNVSDHELAEELGLSRTPVREALIELSKSQVVEIYPQKGSYVSLIDMDLVEEAWFLREVLETAVAELCCDVISEEGLVELEENLRLQEFYVESNHPDKLLELDNLFHEKMFSLCKRMQVYHLMESMTTHFDRIRTLRLSVVKDYQVVKDHRAILGAIRGKQKSEARSLMEEHLNRYKTDDRNLMKLYPHYFRQG